MPTNMSVTLDRPATIDDLLQMESNGKSYELVYGVLVEVPSMSFRESRLAMRLSSPLDQFITKQDLGIVLDSDAKYRLARDPDLVRQPDVSFVSWRHLPGRNIPTNDAVDFAPDLAIEIISPTNRATEIEQKIEDYFVYGVRLVWVIYPDQKHVYVYDAPNRCRILQPGDTLDGGDLLPGFHMSLAELFSELSPTSE